MPKILLTCGFAGGLRPELAGGTVLFDVEKSTGLEGALLSAHAQRGRFHCAERVAATAEEKRALWKSTGADAVEMESQIIRSLCQDRTIPSGTVRVILDTAGEDLPLDFNQLMTSDQSMDYRRLLWTVLRRPAKIKALLHLRRQSEAAADRLAEVLSEILPHAR